MSFVTVDPAPISTSSSRGGGSLRLSFMPGPETSSPVFARARRRMPLFRACGSNGVFHERNVMGVERSLFSMITVMTEGDAPATSLTFRPFGEVEPESKALMLSLISLDQAKKTSMASVRKLAMKIVLLRAAMNRSRVVREITTAQRHVRDVLSLWWPLRNEVAHGYAPGRYSIVNLL